MGDLYEFTSSGKTMNPAEVAKGAINKDKDAEKALSLHYRYLARCSQNLCVMMLLKNGIFWAGDNSVSNIDWIKRNMEVLREEFLHHHKKVWIKDIPLFIQTQKLNLNLIGSIFLAESKYF